MKGSKELLENHMVCWTQNVPYKNTFSCCCRWVCVSLWIIHYLINRPEDFVNRHWTLTSNHIRSSGNCNCHKKKLFTIFYLFCTDLIYFNRRFILVFFLFISRHKLFFTSYHRVQLWYILIYGSVFVSVFVYTMTSCIKRKLQTMVTALDYL